MINSNVQMACTNYEAFCHLEDAIEVGETAWYEGPFHKEAPHKQHTGVIRQKFTHKPWTCT